jgi:transcriptional regulator with XRE-family HTH domain
MRGAIADGDWIRATRISRGLTQEQLAVRADLDVKTVRKAEQGKRLDAGTLARLALALGVNVQSLVRRAEDVSAAQAARRRVVERWQAAWDARDIDAIMALFHEHAELHLPGGPQIPFSGVHRGKESIRRANELAWATAQTVPQQPEDYSLIVSGDSVVLHGRRGVQLPDGNAQWLTNIHIFTFDGDLIIEQRVDYDTLGFSQALGLSKNDAKSG